MKPRTRSLSTNLLFLLALALVPSVGYAGQDVIAVIVHKSNPVTAMSRTELRPIFQTNQKSWSHGGKITPLNLPASDPSRKGFDSAVLGLDPDRVARYWIDRKIRGGARPPKTAPNASLVVAVVGKKSEAVGYVPISKVTDDVKVVAKIKNGQVIAP